MYEDDIVIGCIVFVSGESAGVWVVRMIVGEVRPQCVIDRYVIVFRCFFYVVLIYMYPSLNSSSSGWPYVSERAKQYAREYVV